MSIADQLQKVQDRIASACLRAGRRREEVQLLAVSKTKSIDAIREAIQAGQKIFAENYVQEAIPKRQALSNVEWHFIGSLQTNKVKQVAGLFAAIHTVDRLKLAEALHKTLSEKSMAQKIFVQVHLGDETNKGGVDPTQAPELIRAVLQMPNLHLCGLMALPPLTADEKQSRLWFTQLRNLLHKCQKDFADQPGIVDFKDLSMGTTHDFEWAIAEGATHIRVGTAIFGERGVQGA